MKNKNITIGILAHVDAGKTTLSESMLFHSGAIRKAGRVDKGDSFFDTYEMERKRGITIFSKQAVMKLGEFQVTLLDTPGHVDFSAEMERTLSVLDYAILVISGADGVQGHTNTLWTLLERYRIPTFIFVNKMDQQGTDGGMIQSQLQRELSEGCIDFSKSNTDDFFDEVAMCEEEAMEEYLETGRISLHCQQILIKRRKIFPCFYGSALKMNGVEKFIEGLQTWMEPNDYGDSFGARVFKITRDEKGNRLTHIKVTGGTLHVREIPKGATEKITQIRVYSGDTSTSVESAEAGMVCALMGLTDTFPGQGMGCEQHGINPVLEPVISCQILLPEGCEPAVVLPKLRELEEEEPELHILWDELTKEIHAQVMGEVQIEILKTQILEKYGIEVSFGEGSIRYKETIKSVVEGVGHFEPLRHYAEVHILLEPGELGSGIVVQSKCSEDELAKNWQRLILTHIQEKEHCGVLIGASITDMILTLVGGRAHPKHTEGGDFRQATYRAIRQGLMQAESMLLEPYYEYRIELPEQYMGRAMTDIERMHGNSTIVDNKEGVTKLAGYVPVSTFSHYVTELAAYTKGMGKVSCWLSGYRACHDEEEQILAKHYMPERDVQNPSDSIFCSHGSGVMIPWNHVKEHMHVTAYLQENQQNRIDEGQELRGTTQVEERGVIGVEEIDRIIERTNGANKRSNTNPRKKMPGSRSREQKKTQQTVYRTTQRPVAHRDKYLLVDGYNIIFAWPELNALAETTMDGARDRLMDILCNYQGMKQCEVIVVFDAYRLQGHPVEISRYHNIGVVYTKEAETADQYIEKFAHDNRTKYDITVATSDGLEQIIIRGQGCFLLSASDLKREIQITEEHIREEYLQEEESF